MSLNIEKRHTQAQCPRSLYGWHARPDNIIHHWWNLPHLAGTIDSTATFFIEEVMKKPLNERTSAHYLVSGDRIIELVDPTQAAFHSGSTAGNGRGIGIEIDPRMPGNTMETVAQLCAHLEQRFGSMNHTGHRDWSSTQCPGDVYPRIPSIIARTNQILGGGGAIAPTPPVATGMIFPVTGTISQAFNGGHGLATNLGGGHTGTDYAVATGTPVTAVADGTVLYADWAAKLPTASWASRWYFTGGGYGGLTTDAGIILVIDHGDYLSTYSHLNETTLNTGDRVNRGATVARTGFTGYTIGGGRAGMNNPGGAHLHFEIIPKPFAWGNGFYGRVDAVAFINNRKAAGNTAAVVSTGDWLEMASKNDVKAAVREVLAESRPEFGGRSLWQLLRAVDRAAWNTKKMTRYLFNMYRIGTPGVATDGRMGGLIRKALGYNEAADGKARREEWAQDSQREYDF